MKGRKLIGGGGAGYREPIKLASNTATELTTASNLPVVSCLILCNSFAAEMLEDDAFECHYCSCNGPWSSGAASLMASCSVQLAL